MPVSDQANQMSMLQQAMRQQQQQQMLAPLIQKLMAAQQSQPMGQITQSMGEAGHAPLGQGQGLGALLGGQAAMGQARPPTPPTLGVNQPIPMQMPQADPTGQQQPPPLPPNPTDMSE